ncbi:selenocysteine-specific translation elongation factor [Simplicispira psychrophila]|uniref:selenocysteine-specific translation elongation factor n=1 Tax=Simplicispira psychrophila TaxID=80882 RepID=UPI00048026A8|nr:selenocysteine-specific translation elongation factor [Simplicispira psychrophila]
MIIGTAGHIDHGKTTLVRALTGVETDRLKEEKERGISIELGYAYTPLPNGEVLGIIDVPGHEKFVHTMAAGAVGIDHALLVVAADDGVMPQTREHLDIVLLLGVRQGSVALTKSDRVPPERLAQVQADIAALLAPTALAGVPVFATAATQPDDAGVAALRTHLHTIAQSQPARAHSGLFRLAVDRVFTLPGQGTVVTGTVFGGQVQVGDNLVHSASGQAVRVRSIHAQNQASAQGLAGQRCALNLAGIAKDSIRRGDWIADARVLQASDRIDVRLRLLPDAPRVAQWTPVHVHVGTAHHTAHIALLQGNHIEPGSAVRAQLVLSHPVHTVPGDRLIVRNAQASRTLAGGSVIDPAAPARKRRSAERVLALNALEELAQHGNASAVVAQAPHGMAQSQLVRLSGRLLPPSDLPQVLQLPLGQGDVLLLDAMRWQLLRTQVLAALERFHRKSADEPGLNAARLRRIALPSLPQGAHDALWRGLIDALLQDGNIALSGAWLHLPGHRVQLSAAEENLMHKLLPALEAGHFDPPWVRDLARDIQAGEEPVRQLLRKLARQGQVFQPVKDLFYAAPAMDALAALLHTLAEPAEQGGPSGAVEAHAFRDATGLGRKRAIQVLEFFNRIGYTRRVRDAHLLRPDAQWQASSAMQGAQ